MDEIKNGVKAILQKQEEVEKAVESIKASPPVPEQNKDPRHNDQLTQNSEYTNNALDGLKDEIFRYPFMRFFAHCARQQNFTRQSDAKCIFNYSLSRPVFYNFCRRGDYVLISALFISLFAFSILLVLRFFGFI